MLVGVENAGSLPYASSLCGACYDVCPVKINIPEVLLHLRGEVVRHKQENQRLLPGPEGMAMKMLAGVFASPRGSSGCSGSAGSASGSSSEEGSSPAFPGHLGGWTAMRDVSPRRQPDLPRVVASSESRKRESSTTRPARKGADRERRT